MYFTLLFLSTTLLSALLAPLVRRLASRLKVVDLPKKDSRKIHTKETPLLGGLAIYASFFIVLFALTAASNLFGKSITLSQIVGIFVGATLLMIGGFLDDRYNLKPWQQVLFPVLASFSAVLSGIRIHEITNPFGGILTLAPLLSNLFIFLWLMALMYTTKFLDGLDGLVSGLTVIGSAVIFSLALFTKFYQPEVAALAAILAGASFGFLIWNFHPAKIFLGEGGSTLSGYMLGILAVISGGKIATALLVLGIPLFDMGAVVFRRVFIEKRSPFQADRGHLHFRLLDAGFSHRGAVLFLYALAAGFGFSTLFLQSFGKLLAISLLVLCMGALALLILVVHKKRLTKSL